MTEPRDVPLEPYEQQALQKATDRLERLMHASRQFVRDVIEPPRPGSRIEAAFNGELRDPYEMAHVLIVSAEDHFEGILQIKGTGRLPKFALYTLLRSAGEAAVRCRYLLDPKLSERGRLARALNERLDNLKQVRAFDPKQYKVRLKHLEDRARTNRIAALPEKLPCGKPGRGPTNAFGERRRSLTQLFTDYLPTGSVAFRVLSGYTHSRPWVQLRPSRARPSNQAGISELALDIDVGIFLGVLTKVTDLHDENIRLWFAAAGFEADVWSTAKK